MAKVFRWDDFLSFFNTLKSKLNAKAEKTDLNNVLVSGSQTTTSTADGGSNVYTFTDKSGHTSTLNVRNGSKGSTGNGVSSVEIRYATSTSNTTAPSTWYTSVQSAAAGAYLWTRVRLYYTNGTYSDPYYTVARQGANGSSVTGQRGSKWFSGTAMSGTSTSTGAYTWNDSEQKYVGDMYLNTTYGYVYRCTTAGSGTTAKWTYQGVIKGSNGTNGVNASTIVVAASNSLNKSVADYVCTGSSDETVIASAISALPSSGGKIVLLEGTYNLSDYITAGSAGISIEGMGAGTVLNSTDVVGDAVFRVTADNCKFSNFRITGNNGTIGSILIMSSGCYVHDIWFDKTYICVNVAGTASKYVENNILERLQCASTGLQAIREFRARHTIVSNCILPLTGGGIGIDIGGEYGTVCGNQIYGTMTTGIKVDGKYGNIFGNTVVRDSGATSDYSTSQYTILVDSGATYNKISDNLTPGKNYTNNGGSTNTFADNKYN